MEDVRAMPTGALIENYRLLVRGSGAAFMLDREESVRLSKKADVYEEEINRRMAW